MTSMEEPRGDTLTGDQKLNAQRGTSVAKKSHTVEEVGGLNDG